MITIDAESNELSFDVSDAELEKRRKNWTAPAYKVNSGTLYKYIKNVKTASEGCVTDE
jgi:dihydroxy-acid dehydratase